MILLCSMSSVKMRGDCSFCWYWWNWWSSLFKLSFHNVFGLRHVMGFSGYSCFLHL
jgi:hypothetical protein